MNNIIEKSINTHPDARAIYKMEEGLLYIVDDVEKWNKENIKLNEHEYRDDSVVSRLVNALNNNKYRVNYGVVAYNDLTRALTDWDNLYLASLFHKNCEAINTDSNLTGAIINNRSQALYFAMINRMGMNYVKSLLADTLSLSLKGEVNRERYVDANLAILRDMYSLHNGNDIYNIYEDKYILVDYKKIFDRRNKLLPMSLNEHFDYVGLEEFGNLMTYKAIKSFIRGRNAIEKVFDPLNETYMDYLVKRDEYRFKR